MFVVGATVLTNTTLAPLAIGAALMVMVFAGGHISGAHFNPAVTLGVFLRGRLAAREVLPYWAAQLAGAALGALAAGYVTGQHPAPAAIPRVGPALVAELIVTFALVWVVLNVATSSSHPDNSFYGLAIGFTVLAGAMAVGRVSGGAFNPAVALGTAVMGLTRWADLWVYVVANLLAGALAAFAFTALNTHDR